MGFGSLFKSFLGGDEEAEAAAAPPPPPEEPATRWEKAVSAVNGITQQVAKCDDDGIDVVVVPGEGGEEPDLFEDVIDASDITQIVGEAEPEGPCMLGAALEQVLDDAFEGGFEQPVSVLVVTAGKPDDADKVIEVISAAAQKVEKDEDLTVTFVQVGNDPEATAFLQHLDENLTCTSAAGEPIDIVDTLKDDEIKAAVAEAEDPGFMASGGTGALLGAFTGMAMGVGGVYMYNKMQAKKRTEGWNGNWRVLVAGEEVAQLEVVDDMEGNLTITGWPDDGAAGEATEQASYAEGDGGYQIARHGQPKEKHHGQGRKGGRKGKGRKGRRKGRKGRKGRKERPPVRTNGKIAGTVENEHSISWADGTQWEEIPPEGASWAAYVGAGAAGAVAGGAVGYLVQKKFFKKASEGTESDYVIVLDRSAQMAVPDE